MTNIIKISRLDPNKIKDDDQILVVGLHRKASLEYTPPRLRETTDWVFIYNNPIYMDMSLMRMYECWGCGIFPSVDDFLNCFIQGTKNSGCLVINNRGRVKGKFDAKPSRNKISDVVYFCSNETRVSSI